jgi:EpsI family protein
VEACGLATVFLTLAFVGVAPQAREVGLARPLESLPMHLGQWSAELPPALGDVPSNPLAPVSAWSNADRRLTRLYRLPSGETISVELYYYAVQSQGHELVSDTSAELHRKTSAVVIDSGSNRFSANAGEWSSDGETALFWYDTNGRIESGQIATKLATLWRAILSGHTNGAAIVLRTTTRPTSLDELQDLAKALQPALVGLWTSDAP